ncbi:polysaccharide deacetylase family protein [Accumulibacter sp.]|uniref:polysaccharide deacetylase family protein n=1 Tax=Accumulibacter sp. TaxID=2053492 RepID=UPI0025C06D1B|nr:polysaccharide deacetylase family protein [Accumulibacter sp.]
MTATLAKATLGALDVITPRRLSILIYHRVHARPDSLFPHEPDTRSFDQRMRFVARSFNVLSLGEAVHHLAAGTLPPRALAITFDDGYADNAEVALPILRRHGLTATFFVATGFLDGGRMWNDSVIECLRTSTKPALDLEAFGLGRLPLPELSDRRAAIEQLLPRIKYLTLAQREEAVVQLQAITGVAALPADLMMRTDQIRALHSAGMEIGAHTVRHPILASLTLAEAEIEIVEGKRCLEAMVDAPVDVFAYPNGKPGQDYQAEHVKLVEKVGFRGAVTTSRGVAQTGDDLFQLPRYTPWGNALPVWSMRLLAHQRRRDFQLAPPCANGQRSKPA